MAFGHEAWVAVAGSRKDVVPGTLYGCAWPLTQELTLTYGCIETRMPDHVLVEKFDHAVTVSENVA